MRIIIAGSRNFEDYNFLKDSCNYSFQNIKDITIISGTANGADKLGEKYAIENNLSLIKYPANWNKYGKSADYKRNEEMAKNADGLIVFWDGESKGTKHMIDLAKQYKLKVKIYLF